MADPENPFREAPICDRFGITILLKSIINVYYKTWANKGILFLKDLFNNTSWLTYDELCMKYYFRPPFTVYNGMILANKMDKYRELGTVQMQIIPNCLQELLKTNVCKNFYKECVNGYTSKHKINAQIKWHHILGTELCDKWWEMYILSLSS